MNDATCGQCGGYGTQTYEDHGHYCEDVCYHCCGTGTVDAYTYWRDRLYDVALSLAHYSVDKRWDAANAHPDFEGWGLYAAESGCTTWELRHEFLLSDAAKHAEALAELPQEKQEVLVAWNEVLRA